MLKLAAEFLDNDGADGRLSHPRESRTEQSLPFVGHPVLEFWRV